MKELYLMRHAQTLFNVQGRTQGWSDSPLTQKGIEDALKAGEDFEQNNFALMPSTLPHKNVLLTLWNCYFPIKNTAA
jgi:Fructose-2,6-bisphosphatase